MKTFTILFLLLVIPIFVMANGKNEKRSKSEWYRHFDERLTALEKQLADNMEAMQQQQQLITEEMHRMNSKLENRFDRYFLWGYGTLLVVISTIASIIFTKQRLKKQEDEGVVKMYA